MRHTSVVLLTAALVVLAGCSGLTGDPGATDGPDAGTDDPVGSGTVSVYVSDQPNAIDRFEHLNATVTEVGFRRAGGNDSDGEWVTVDVDERTVDLTEYRGENATRLTDTSVPNGTYTGVYLRVSAVEGTLVGGGSADVKLPSERLRLGKEFAVGDGEAVDFVFDVSVVAAGESGGYVLKPVAGESGADQPYRTADDDGGLDARLIGPVERGQAATLKVTAPGGPASGAVVEVNGRRVGETGGDGTISVRVPDEGDLEVTVRHEGREAELERDFGDEGRGNDGERGPDGGDERGPDGVGPPG